MQRMQWSPRSWRMHALLVLVLQLISACAGSSLQGEATPTLAPPTATAVPDGRTSDTLRLVYYDAPTLLNPHLVGGLKDLEASRIVYEPLASFDADNHLVPFLAAEIPSRENGGVAADGLSVTWKLKQGLRWSDGQPFSAADVQFTFDYITNPQVQATFVGSYAAVRSVDVLDSTTVRVTFKAPTLAWAVPFVGKPGMILPRHIFAPFNGPNARNAEANRKPVGTGPYRIVGTITPQEVLFLGNQLVKTNKIVFEPNPYFREPDTPFFRRVELRGGGTIEQAFRTVLDDGSADYAWNIQLSVEQQAALKAHTNGRIAVNLGPNIRFIPLNQTDPAAGSEPAHANPIFQDKRVRQAFASAIDRARIAREIYGAAGLAEHNFVVLPEDYRSPNQYYAFDLPKAAALLDEAGWVDHDGDQVRDKDGRPLQLTYQVPVSPSAWQIYASIGHDLASIGIDLVADPKDSSVFFGIDTTNPSSYVRFLADTTSWDWINDSHDPVPNLSYWTCASIPTAANHWSGFNISRWCNPEFDQLLAHAQGEIDAQRRRALLIRLNDMLIEDVAFIVIARVPQLSAINTTIQGVELTPWDADTWKIKDWKRDRS